MHHDGNEKVISDSLAESGINFARLDIPGVGTDFLSFYAKAQRDYQPEFPEIFTRMNEVINQARLHTGELTQSGSLEFNKALLREVVTQIPHLPESEQTRSLIYRFNQYFSRTLNGFCEEAKQTSDSFALFNPILAEKMSRTADALQQTRQGLQSLTTEVGFPNSTTHSIPKWSEVITATLKEVQFGFSAEDQKSVAILIQDIAQLQDQIAKESGSFQKKYQLQYAKIRQEELKPDPDRYAIEEMKEELEKHKQCLLLTIHSQKLDKYAVALGGIANFIDVGVKTGIIGEESGRKLGFLVNVGVNTISLGQKFITLTQTVIQSGFSMALLGPLGAVAAGCYGLYSLFGDDSQKSSHGPYLEIMEGLNNSLRNISEQMNAMRQEMRQGFGIILKNIEGVRETTLLGLDFLEKMQQHRHRQLLTILQKINDQGQDIHRDMRESRSENKVYFKESYTQNYKVEAGRILSMLRDHSESKMSKQCYQKNFGFFVSSINGVNLTTLAGALESPVTIDMASFHKLAESIVANGIEENINPLAGFVRALKVNIEVKAPIINPSAWSMRVIDFINFMQMAVQHAPDDKQVPRFRDIVSAGKQAEDLIKQIKVNWPLFHRLLQGYHEALIEIKKQVVSIVLCHAFPDDKDDVERMRKLRARVLEKNYPWHQELLFRKQETVKQQALFTELQTFQDTTRGRLAEVNFDELNQLYIAQTRDFDEKIATLNNDVSEMMNVTAIPGVGLIGNLALFLGGRNELKAIGPLRNSANIQLNRAMNAREGWVKRRELQALLDTYINPRFVRIQHQLAFCEREEKRVELLAVDKEDKALSDDQIIQEYLTRYHDDAGSMNVRSILTRKIIEAVEIKNSSLEQAVRKLETFFVLINAFAALAFRREYTVNQTMRYLLQSALWEKDRFITYLKNPDHEKNSDEFIYSVLTGSLLAGFSQVEVFLARKIVKAKQEHENKRLRADYPIIDYTFEYLEKLRMLLFPTADFGIPPKPAPTTPKKNKQDDLSSLNFGMPNQYDLVLMRLDKTQEITKSTIKGFLQKNKTFQGKPILIKKGNVFAFYDPREKEEWQLIHELDANKFKRLKFDNLPTFSFIIAGTAGGGDCALHAILGKWNEDFKQFRCSDIEEKRKEISDAIVNKEIKEPLKKLIMDGVKELIMSGRNIGIASQKLIKTYQEFLSDQKYASFAFWLQFEKVLQQYPSIIKYIKDNHDPKLSLFRAQFYDALNKNNGKLYKEIGSLPTLHEAFKEYNEGQNAALDWDYKILESKDIIKEYADFIGRPSTWLLPSELSIIAHIFKVEVLYYPGPGAVPLILNPGGLSKVGVQFNGGDHFERVIMTQHEPAYILPRNQVPEEVYQEIALRKAQVHKKRENVSSSSSEGSSVSPSRKRKMGPFTPEGQSDSTSVPSKTRYSSAFFSYLTLLQFNGHTEQRYNNDKKRGV